MKDLAFLLPSTHIDIDIDISADILLIAFENFDRTTSSKADLGQLTMG